MKYLHAFALVILLLIIPAVLYVALFGLPDSREWKVPARDEIDALQPTRVGSKAVNLPKLEGTMEASTDSSETSPVSDAAINCSELQAEVDSCRENEGALTIELEASGRAWITQHADKRTWQARAGRCEDWRQGYERRHRVNGTPFN